MRWGEKLAQRRKEKGLSQEEVGRALGMTQQSYGAYERGKADPSLSTLLVLRKLLDFNMEDLVDDSVESLSPESDAFVVRGIIRDIGYRRARLRLISPSDEPPVTKESDITHTFPRSKADPSEKAG